MEHSNSQVSVRDVAALDELTRAPVAWNDTGTVDPSRRLYWKLQMPNPALRMLIWFMTC